jgi:hypothetical protein
MNCSNLGCEQENNPGLAAVPAVSLRAPGIEVFDAILTPVSLKYCWKSLANASIMGAQDNVLQVH